MLQTEQLRAFLLEYLKTVVNRRDQLQYASYLNGVEHIAKERCPDLFAHGEAFETTTARSAKTRHLGFDS